MIDENLFKKSISFWNLKNNEFELLAHRENITYKVYDLEGSCFVLRFHRKNYSDYDEENIGCQSADDDGKELHF